ncbi:MAG: hypothetical protein HY791_00905 [Deltaproteobacteria bacterium]|nr:hypothetical protein [Deltaproteobacteria bacterium]
MTLFSLLLIFASSQTATSSVSETSSVSACLMSELDCARRDALFRYDLRVGHGFHFTDGTVIRVGEHSTLADRPLMLADFEFSSAPWRVAVAGKLLDERELDVLGRIELDHTARLELDAARSLHRLDHDPLSYLGFPGAAGLEVADRDPDRSYEIQRTRWGPTLTLDLPTLGPISDVRLTAAYRSLARDGHDQARTITHCGSCHVEATTRSIDERTQELTLGLEGRLMKQLGLSLRVQSRALDERAAAPELLEPFQPPLLGSLIKVSGKLPFGRAPDTTRTSLAATADWRGPSGLSAGMSYSGASSVNLEIEKMVRTHVAGGRVSIRPSRVLSAKAHYRIMSSESEVDNAIDRTGHRLGVDADYTVGRAHKVSVGYVWSNLARQNVLLTRRAADPATGDYFVETRGRRVENRHEFRAGVSGWLKSVLRGRADFRLVALRGALSTVGNQTSFAPASGSNPYPDSPGMLPLRLTQAPRHLYEIALDVGAPILGVTVHPRYKLRMSGGNPLNRASTDHSAGLLLSWAPNTWISANASYAFMRNEIQSDVYYGQVGGLLANAEGFVDIDEVTYLGTAHTGLATLTLSPVAWLTLRASGTLTKATSAFGSDGLSSTLGTLSAVGVDARMGEAAAELRWARGFTTGVTFRATEILDLPSRRLDGRDRAVWIWLRAHEGTAP